MSYLIQEYIPDKVYVVGVIDYSVRVFHGYHTEKGTSYNSALIKATDPSTNKVFGILVDSVKDCFAKDHIARIKATMEHIGCDELRYAIVNHAENDHTGSLPVVYENFPNLTFVSNTVCKNVLDKLYPTLQNAKWIKLNQKENTFSPECLEKYTFVNVPTPLLHWPDSSVTFVPELNLLLSNDAFGQHYSTSNLWFDQEDRHEIMTEFKSYTANILGLCAVPLKKALDIIGPLLPQIKTIICAHGVCYRRQEDIMTAVEEYSSFAAGTNHKKPIVTIIFDSMWHATEKACKDLEQQIVTASNNAIKVNWVDIKASDLTHCALYAYQSAAVIFGSPTLNGGMMPTIAAVLNYIKGLKLLNDRFVSALGCYGWAEKSVKDIYAAIDKTGAKPVGTGITFKNNYDEAAKATVLAHGKEIASLVMDYVKQ